MLLEKSAFCELVRLWTILYTMLFALFFATLIDGRIQVTLSLPFLSNFLDVSFSSALIIPSRTFQHGPDGGFPIVAFASLGQISHELVGVLTHAVISSFTVFALDLLLYYPHKLFNVLLLKVMVFHRLIMFSIWLRRSGSFHSFIVCRTVMVGLAKNPRQNPSVCQEIVQSQCKVHTWACISRLFSFISGLRNLLTTSTITYKFSRLNILMHFLLKHSIASVSVISAT